MSYRRVAEDRRRLIRLAGETESRWGCGAYFCDRKGRYIRYYRSNANGASQYHRRQSNRRVRRKGDIYQRGQYRRVYDYWWNLF